MANAAPPPLHLQAASAFFLAWMIVGCFVAINLFVGAIVDNFTRIKKETARTHRPPRPPRNAPAH